MQYSLFWEKEPSNWNWLPLGLIPSISNFQWNFKHNTSRKNLWLSCPNYHLYAFKWISEKNSRISLIALKLPQTPTREMWLKFLLVFQCWNIRPTLCSPQGSTRWIFQVWTKGQLAVMTDKTKPFQACNWFITLSHKSCTVGNKARGLKEGFFY